MNFRLIILIGLLLLTACSREDRAFVAMLDRADSLMQTHPDSALALLDAAGEQEAKESSSQGVRKTSLSMRYWLLKADALNKTYGMLPSDTLMKEVVEYYDRHGNANERMRAHYLLGCVYRDMGEAPMALECYQQATEQADTTRADCDFYRLSTIFYQRAELLRRQVLYSQELEELRHSERFAMLAGDTIAAIDRHFYQGMAYLHLKDTIKAIQLISMAASQFRDAGKEKSAAQCMGGVILPYINRRQYHLAQLAIDEYEKNSGCVIDGRVVKGREIFYYMKGMYYLGLHQIDSALFYFNREMSAASDYNNRIAAYRGLSLSYQQKGIPDSSAKYSILAYNLNDSAYTLETASLTARMKSMYDYAGYQKQAYQKEQEKNLFFRWLIIALSVIALCFGVIWRGIIIYKI